MATNLALRSDPAGFGAIQLGTQDVVKITDKGIVPLAGQAPAFSAYSTVATLVAAAEVATKILFQAEEYDTNSNYDTSTSKFTPTVAGYYHIDAAFQITAAVTTLCAIIYKNGTPYKNGGFSGNGSNSSSVSSSVYLNGTTDYVEIYGKQAAAAQTTLTSSSGTYFNGFLARAA